ncbi:hypothetical protein [Franconibacter pulveris]|uniref:hypothetical protein n=1 Tax=Franconibacter pulveris TaxID=435910 RepID=UPI000F671564|nr:hypothetical protein [Franconibacter pulveris]
MYEQGTSHYSSVSSNTWASNRSIGRSKRRGSGVRQSAVASRNAPRSGGLEAFVFLFSFCLYAYFAFHLQNSLSSALMLLLLAFGLASLTTGLVAHLNRKNRRKAHSDYEKQWYCKKCGEIFLYEGKN